MRIKNTVQEQGTSRDSGPDSILREAKKLHRAAVSQSLSESLPVLRRLLSAQVIRGLTLPELSRRRGMVRRKHVLRTLAVEAGFSSWEAFRGSPSSVLSESLRRFEVLERKAGYPNLWFSSFEEAERHAAINGGRAIRFGQQAVVFAEDFSAG